jgi:site-specific recombinase XerD
MSGLHAPKTYRRGAGWRCDGYVRLPDHTSRRITGNGRTQAAARDAWLANAERALAGLAHPKQPLREYLETWLTRRPGSVSHETFKRDAQLVRQYLIPEFGNVPLESFTQGHVKDLIVKMKANGRPKDSIVRTLAPLKRAFSDAMRDRVINQNPVARIEIGRDEHQFTRKQLDAVKMAQLLLSEPPSPPRDLLAVLAMTGLRLNEARGLWVGDLRLGQEELQLEYAASRSPKPVRQALKTKNSRRTVYLPLACVQVLREALARHEGGPKPEAWVFDRGDGVPPTMSQLRRSFESFSKRHALETGIRIHDMRGAVASALANAGETVATAQQALGHSNVITTLTYYNLAREGAVKQGIGKLFESLAVPGGDDKEQDEGSGEGGSHQKSHQIGEAQPVWRVEKTGRNDLFRTRDAGGERGIRTLDGVAPKPHFQCGAIDH